MSVDLISLSFSYFKLSNHQIITPLLCDAVIQYIQEERKIGSFARPSALINDIM